MSYKNKDKKREVGIIKCCERKTSYEALRRTHRRRRADGDFYRF